MKRMKRKWFAILLSAILVLSMSVTTVFASGITVYRNAEVMQFDGTQPQMIDNSVYVPGRTLFEREGMTLQWDEATKTVYACTEGYKCMKFKVDSSSVETYDIMPDEGNLDELFKDMTVVGDVKTDDIGKPVKLVDGRVLFPLRSLSQFFGYKEILWDGGSKTVYLKSVDSTSTAPEGAIEVMTSSGLQYYYPATRKFVPETAGQAAVPETTTTDTTTTVTKTTSSSSATDRAGKAIKVGDKVETCYIGTFELFYGTVKAINGTKVQVQWYDVTDMFGSSELTNYEYYDTQKFSTLQTLAGVDFNNLQWLEGNRIYVD